MPDVQPNFKPPKPRGKQTVSSLGKKADRLWGELIHVRDRYCQFCGRTDGKLDAHHIMPRTFKATRWDVANGLLLCFHCHQSVAHGDPFTAVLHYNRILGEDWYRALREKAYAGGKTTVQGLRDTIAALEADLILIGGV